MSGALPAEVVAARADPRRTIGRYVLLEKLGQGGMGVVHRAFDLGLHRSVAIKLLHPAPGGPASAERRLARFRREASATGRLRHEGIVSIHEVGEHHGHPFIVMDLVDGESLQAILDREELDPRRLADVVRRAALAIQHAHDQDIVHRDVKPENILVDGQGRPRIVDFGLAFDAAAERLTMSGELLGTPLYMAPEQLADGGGDRAGPPTDVYGLGGVLYRGLTGSPPFVADAMINVVRMLARDEPVAPRRRNPATPPALEAITLRCLRKRPADRFASAAELAAALGRFLDGDDDPTDRARPAGATLALAVASATVTAGLVIGLAFALGGGDPASSSPGGPDPHVPASVPDATPASDEARPAPPPAPAPGDEWRPTWTSVDGAEATRTPTPLWSSDGVTADPLAGARAGGPRDALAAAFVGEAERRDGGRVAVRYDPARHGRVVALSSHGFFSRGGVVGTPDVVEGAASIRAENDAGKVELRVGDARWESPRISARVSIGAIDATVLTIGDLVIHGRERTVTARGVSVRRPLEDDIWHDIVVAPGAPAGRRVRIDGLSIDELDEALGPRDAERDAGAPLALGVAEGEFRFGPVEVEGRCRRSDLPARATAPPRLGAAARVAAAFHLDDASAADGPFVAIGEPAAGKVELVAELAGGRLILRHLRGPIATAALEAPAGPVDGWIILERRGDRLEASAALGEVRATIVAAEPLPILAAELRASWGSLGAPVRFGAISVHESSDETRRAEYDTLARENGQALLDRPDTLGRDPRQIWRVTSIALARSAETVWADVAFVGRPEERSRLARATLAALRWAADGLRDDPVARADALARAVVAAIIARDTVAADVLSGEIVDEIGAEAARTRIDQVVRSEGHGFSRDLIRGLGPKGVDPMASHTATVVAERVFPDRRATILEHRARSLLEVATRLPEEMSQPLELRQEALVLLRRAVAEGARGGEAEGALAELLAELGRPTEAIPHWRSVAEQRPDAWIPWARLGALLADQGDPIGAVEAFLASLAANPRSPVVRPLQMILSDAGLDTARPGLAAVALLALADRTERNDPGAAARLRERVRRIMATVAAKRPRDADLLLYAGARLGQTLSASADRPTAVLLRARLDPTDPARLAELRRAAEASHLVRALAILDPELSLEAPADER